MKTTMSAPCCENCEYADKRGNCRSNGTECAKWRQWFRKEWAEIQRAAKLLREENKEASQHDKGRT